MTGSAITFVDCANVKDRHQDGSFKHPYACIRTATERAGENAVIFVQSGLYNESVVLRPGQTLTSRIHGHEAPAPPVIRGVNHDRKYAFEWEEYDGVTVVMRENCVLRRLIVLADQEKTAAILLLPERTENGQRKTRLTVEECEIQKKGRYGEALAWFPQNVNLDLLEIRRNRILVDCDEAEGIHFEINQDTSLGTIEIFGNMIDVDSHAGISLDIEKSKVSVVKINSNNISAGDNGIDMLVNSAKVDLFEFSNNTISSYYYDGICLDVEKGESLIRGVHVRNNAIFAKGEQARALALIFEQKARMDCLRIEGNALNAIGQESVGLHLVMGNIVVEELELEQWAISDNAIRASGRRARGLWYEQHLGFWPELDFAQANNAITAGGEGSTPVDMET